MCSVLFYLLLLEIRVTVKGEVGRRTCKMLLQIVKFKKKGHIEVEDLEIKYSLSTVLLEKYSHTFKGSYNSG